MRKGAALIIAAYCLTLPAAYGAEEEEANMEAVSSDLQDTLTALDETAKQSEVLQAREMKLQKELTNLQENLVTIAARIQNQEKLLSDLEQGLQKLNAQEEAIRKDLQARRKELADAVSGMLKLSAAPPELVIAMPGSFTNTLRTAKVLGLTSEALTHKAAVIQEQLTKIDTLQARIEQSREKIAAQKTTLETNQVELTGKVDARSKLHSQLHERNEEFEQKLARLSDESANLRDLLGQLETERVQGAEKANALAVIPKSKPKIPSTATQGLAFSEAKGKISLPAEGKIFSFYGDKTQDGDTSRGITLRTRESAHITAPFAGEVVFTGSFLEYGNLVIIRHEGNYHTLLAGFDSITAEPGQTILEGEPLGTMGNTDQTTMLYMEIRKDNRPIDPQPWLNPKQYARN